MKYMTTTTRDADDPSRLMPMGSRRYRAQLVAAACCVDCGYDCSATPTRPQLVARSATLKHDRRCDMGIDGVLQLCALSRSIYMYAARRNDATP